MGYVINKITIPTSAGGDIDEKYLLSLSKSLGYGVYPIKEIKIPYHEEFEESVNASPKRELSSGEEVIDDPNADDEEKEQTKARGLSKFSYDGDLVTITPEELQEINPESTLYLTDRDTMFLYIPGNWVDYNLSIFKSSNYDYSLNYRSLFSGGFYYWEKECTIFALKITESIPPLASNQPLCKGISSFGNSESQYIKKIEKSNADTRDIINDAPCEITIKLSENYAL